MGRDWAKIPGTAVTALAVVVASLLSAEPGSANEVEVGRCAKETAFIVLAMEKILSQGNLVGVDDSFRKSLAGNFPKGKCDLSAVRKVLKGSKYFHSDKFYDGGGEEFRLSSNDVVSGFYADTKTNEILRNSIYIRIKKTYGDYE